MVLNPLMMIPFIFVPVINTIIAYTCMALNIVGKGVVETPWTTPAPIGAAWAVWISKRESWLLS